MGRRKGRKGRRARDRWKAEKGSGYVPAPDLLVERAPPPPLLRSSGQKVTPQLHKPNKLITQ